MDESIWQDTVVLMAMHFLRSIALLLGAVKIFQIVVVVVQGIERNFLRKPTDLINRYSSNGEAPWALVTGASDGIGAEYCKILAQQGFNICLVSRTMSKLQTIEAEVKKINSSVKTRIVQADFAENTKFEYYKKSVVDQVQDIRISLLIVNAGVLWNGEFAKIPQSNLQYMLDVNVYHVMAMVKLFAPKMGRAGARSGIMVTASINSKIACPYAATYGATKVFDNQFTLALQEEFKHAKLNIDLMATVPSFVQTAMIDSAKGLNPLQISSASDMARCTLRDLGKEKQSSGTFGHDLQQPYLNLLQMHLPQSIKAIVTKPIYT